ncbi:TetR/AcrR family transcriptional regulator [Undibacterium rugosum]|uniref:TetR/AcrR family transcriptional regulator n=1 Tax=Undibacterium rugosum TaxID=2762291 RepID=A0A923I1Z0_9BURK|nr:TetR/AcrR family transcriptional regulator [Undibacterium rugosum]MBC3936196.1 TetR/AcrR family transcriptional regulator [Undibacterium rugosum]MBR7779172.1 TetR/AcrR family transcriptional regulator [Undibacterium rugosum]
MKNDRRVIDAATLENLRRTILTMFAKNSFNDVGIREICKKARVSPQTIYKYFGSKEEMLYACVRQDIEKLNELALAAARRPRSADQQIRAFLEAWVQFFGKNPNIASIVFLNIPQTYWVSKRHFLQLRVNLAGHATIKRGQKAGVITKKIDPVVLQDLMMGACHRVMIRWLTLEKNNLPLLSKQMITGVMNMIKA